jgi:hypothetical protein
MAAILAALVWGTAVSPGVELPVAPDLPPAVETRLKLEIELSALLKKRAEVPMALGITLLVVSVPVSGAAFALLYVGFQNAIAPTSLLFFGVAPFLPYLGAVLLLGAASAVCSLTGLHIINTARDLDSRVAEIQEQLASPAIVPSGPGVRF